LTLVNVTPGPDTLHAYLKRAVEEAERAFDAAKGRTSINAAKRKLDLTKAELQQLEEEEEAKRGATRGRGDPDASS
jgi:hypothetical protein